MPSDNLTTLLKNRYNHRPGDTDTSYPGYLDALFPFKGMTIVHSHLGLNIHNYQLHFTWVNKTHLHNNKNNERISI